jgi:ABC-type dipeptide/oligopeptide/nickel transport system permease subunit
MTARSILKNKKLFIGLIMLTTFLTLGVFAPLIIPYPYDRTYVGPSLKGPSPANWFGTDRLGRDVFSRVLYGTRVSLIAAIGVTCVSLLVGVPLGLLGGYYGGAFDLALMRIVDIFFTFPWVLMGLLVVVIRGQGLDSVIIALSLSYFPQIVRVVRSTVLTIKGQDFITAARLTGENDRNIIFRYILPNCLAPLIVQASIVMSFSILGEAALSYLGYGTRPPLPSWGILLQEATNYIWGNGYLVVFPGIFIVFSVFTFNFTGDGLRDILDPRYRRIYD